MKYSNKIAKNFSKGASRYGNEAHTQRLSSNKLIELLKETTSTLIDGKCLEIGCGTGFVTEHILKLLPNRAWEITDLSQEMINLCQRNMLKIASDNSGTTYKCFDGEQISASNEYALIVSGMTFQWFKDCFNSLHRLKDALKPEGILCFSYLNQNSFQEWKDMCKQVDVPCSMTPLPTIKDISELFVDSSWSTYIETENHKIAYTSAKEFLKHLKNIGANATPQKPLTAQEMRKLIHHWDEQAPLGVTVTYSITYVVAKKVGR